jgi:hypothetical protein
MPIKPLSDEVTSSKVRALEEIIYNMSEESFEDIADNAQTRESCV